MIVAHPRRPDVVEAAHTLVYCSVSTVDRAGRPRSRVMHPIWEWDGRRLTGWLASMPSPKMAHLAGRPYVSCAYHDGWAVAVVADSRIEPITDDAGRTHVWELLRAAPPQEAIARAQSSDGSNSSLPSLRVAASTRMAW